MTASDRSQQLYTGQSRFLQKAFFPAIVAAWTLNTVLIVATAAWVFFDGRSPIAPNALWDNLHLASGLTGKTGAGISSTGQAGRWIATSGMAMFGASSVLILLGLVSGPPRWRNLRSWLLAMGIACCWCGLFVVWPDLHWKGQQFRVAKFLPQATLLAERLNTDWPAEDGEIDGVGTFLAYPKSSPSTLLMLAKTDLTGTSMQFSAVEKTEDSAIRFELSEPRTNVWLEWRNDGRDPSTFVGGLKTLHEVLRYERLDTNWFLVRYATSAE